MRSGRYAVELVTDAEKDLKRLRPWTDQLALQLLRLEEHRLAGHPLTGALRGTRALEFNLKGGGAYRAVYTVLDEERICVVLVVGPHSYAQKRWLSLAAQWSDSVGEHDCRGMILVAAG